MAGSISSPLTPRLVRRQSVLCLVAVILMEPVVRRIRSSLLFEPGHGNDEPLLDPGLPEYGFRPLRIGGPCNRRHRGEGNFGARQ